MVIPKILYVVNCNFQFFNVTAFYNICNFEMTPISSINKLYRIHLELHTILYIC